MLLKEAFVQTPQVHLRVTRLAVEFLYRLCAAGSAWAISERGLHKRKRKLMDQPLTLTMPQSHVLSLRQVVRQELPVPEVLAITPSRGESAAGHGPPPPVGSP